MLIEFAEADSASQAMQEMDRIVIDDCKIKVQPAWQAYRKQSFTDTINKLVESGIVRNNASPDD